MRNTQCYQSFQTILIDTTMESHGAQYSTPIQEPKRLPVFLAAFCLIHMELAVSKNPQFSSHSLLLSRHLPALSLYTWCLGAKPRPLG